jgi:hypothetical protein
MPSASPRCSAVIDARHLALRAIFRDRQIEDFAIDKGHVREADPSPDRAARPINGKSRNESAEAARVAPSLVG